MEETTLDIKRVCFNYSAEIAERIGVATHFKKYFCAVSYYGAHGRCAAVSLVERGKSQRVAFHVAVHHAEVRHKQYALRRGRAYGNGINEACSSLIVVAVGYCPVGLPAQQEVGVFLVVGPGGSHGKSVQPQRAENNEVGKEAFHLLSLSFGSGAKQLG